MINFSGCPHDGGQHTLKINDTVDNVCAWLDLVKEVAPRSHHQVIDAMKQHVLKRVATTPAEKRLFKYNGFDAGSKINLSDGPLQENEFPDFEIGAYN